MRSLSKSPWLLALGVLAAFPTPAAAGSCDALIDDLATWVSQPPGLYGDIHQVHFVLVGNRQTLDRAEYTVGELSHAGGWSSGGMYWLQTLSGDGYQRFSDRTRDWVPFDPYAGDVLGVSFLIDPAAGDAFGDLTLTWRSEANRTATLETECRGDYLYAFDGEEEMFAFTFRKCSLYSCP
jgi:hypothetical protein